MCLLHTPYCMCPFRRQLKTRASFLLLMYDDEVLKPSNSGRLIADLVPDTHAYLWSRTQVDPELIGVLNDPQYQPYIIFPEHYASPDQEIVQQPHDLSSPDWSIDPQCDHARSHLFKRPLFVLLDGSWREAKKMFRKSPYLSGLPIFSFQPQEAGQYELRKGQRDFQLSTAEVAILAIESLGEVENAEAFKAWFSLFIESSLLSRNRAEGRDLTLRDQLAVRFQAQWAKTRAETCHA